jgi:hypothetical protein
MIFGGQCRTRTCDLLLVSNAATKIQSLTPSATNYYGLLQTTVFVRVFDPLIALCSNRLWIRSRYAIGYTKPVSAGPSFPNASTDLTTGLAVVSRPPLFTKKISRIFAILTSWIAGFSAIDGKWPLRLRSASNFPDSQCDYPFCGQRSCSE